MTLGIALDGDLSTNKTGKFCKHLRTGKLYVERLDDTFPILAMPPNATDDPGATDGGGLTEMEEFIDWEECEGEEVDDNAFERDHPDTHFNEHSGCSVQRSFRCRIQW